MAWRTADTLLASGDVNKADHQDTLRVPTRRFETRADAAAASILPSASTEGLVALDGYSTPGVGRSHYEAVAAEPSHDVWFQDAASQHWALKEPHVTPQMCGAEGDGTTNDTAAMDKGIAYAKATGAALLIPPGTYLLDAGGGTNFAGNRLAIIGIGKPVLKFTGSGIGFNLDSGGMPAARIAGMRVENLVIEGNASVTDGFFSRGIVRSYFNNIEVRECSAKAFHIQHAVASTYDGLAFSLNDTPSQTTTPTHGLYLTDDDTHFTADCTIIEPRFEGFAGTGIYLDYASGNTFVAGTSEAVTKGVVIASGCTNNTFGDLWCEANATSDVEDSGAGTQFTNPYLMSATTSLNVQAITSDGLMITGGWVRAVNLQSTSDRTALLGVGFSDNASLGIQGSGDYTALGCYEFNTSGVYTGALDDLYGGEKTSFSPTLEGLTTEGSATYTTQTGNYVLNGRTVSIAIVLTTSAFSGAAGTLIVSGVPTANVTTPIAISQWNGITLPSGQQLCAEVVGGTDYIRFYATGSGVAPALLVPADASAATTFVIAGTYIK